MLINTCKSKILETIQKGSNLKRPERNEGCVFVKEKRRAILSSSRCTEVVERLFQNEEGERTKSCMGIKL